MQVKLLKGMEENMARFYIASIVLAMEYLHNHNIGEAGTLLPGCCQDQGGNELLRFARDHFANGFLCDHFN